MTRAAELEAAIARVYGVTVATAMLLPSGDGPPELLLGAAEAIGEAIGDRPAAPPSSAPAWEPLPQRPVSYATASERRDAVARSLAWAKGGGARWDGIEIHVDEHGGASARTVRALEAGETILRLPGQLMIVEPDANALAVWLALETRDPTSPWRGYLDAVPVRFDELPVFHDAADLAQLAGTMAHQLAERDNRDVRASYAALASEIRAQVSLAAFAWGRALVRSRAFHAPGSVEPKVALVPIVDLFNHRLGDTTWTFEPLEDVLAITTERAFSAGEPVGFPYGERSNSRLLVHYGFTEDDNAIGEASLAFEPAADPVTAIAADLLWGLPVGEPARYAVGTVFDRYFVRALSVARLRAAGSAEREQLVQEGMLPYGDVPWLGAGVEERAFAILGDAARRALAELDGTAAPSGDRPWPRSCAAVRASERAVLLLIAELARIAPSHLDARDPEAIAIDARGAERLLRQYLRAHAD